MILLTITLLTMAFIAYAIKYTLLFHFHSSVFKNLNYQYWHAGHSWKNKYTDNGVLTREPKFFLSTSLLVFLTDAFHLFQFLFLNCLFLAIAINIQEFQWWINFIGTWGIYGIVFNLFFDKVLIRK